MATTPEGYPLIDSSTKIAPFQGHYNAIAQALDIKTAELRSGANVLKGKASERTLALPVNGVLWQDIDGAKLLWRRDSSVSGGWTPAVMRWRGTTAQMEALSAPDGFEWYNTTNNSEYVRAGGAWVSKHPFAYFTLSSGRANSNAWSPMYGTNASWDRDSASSPGITWDTQGIKVSEGGLYEISASFYVGVANITMLFGAKLNNFEPNATNLFVATNTRIMDYGTTTGLSFTRVRRLSAGDKITPTVWTNGTAGPYGLAAYGTSVFLRKVSP